MHTFHGGGNLACSPAGKREEGGNFAYPLTSQQGQCDNGSNTRCKKETVSSSFATNVRFQPACSSQKEKESNINGNMQCEYYDISGGDSDLVEYSDSTTEHSEEPEGSIVAHGHAEAGINSLSGTHGPESGMLTTVISLSHQNDDRTYRDAQNINKIVASRSTLWLKLMLWAM